MKGRPVSIFERRVSATSSQLRRAVVSLALPQLFFIVGSLLHPALRAAQTRETTPAAQTRETIAAAQTPETTPAATTPIWPSGTEVLSFENLEGVILVRARLIGEGGRDTTGWMIVDTGAGMLALDVGVAARLGLAGADVRPLRLMQRALARMELGKLQIDQVKPILSVDLGPVQRVTDRPVLGLIGESLFRGRVLYVDYAAEVMAIVPAPAEHGASHRDVAARLASSKKTLRGVLAAGAVGVPIRIEGDGKLIVRGRVADPEPSRMSRWLTLAIDTGATKGILFEDVIADVVRHRNAWPRLDGFSAQNLYGAPDASLVRVPRIELETAAGPLSESGVILGIMKGPLARVLGQSVGETVHGVMGYSFLRRFRMIIDYPRRVMWLERHDGSGERPFEYSHVGIQIERFGDDIRVHAVASETPAAEAGIKAGDLVMAIDGRGVRERDLVEVGLLLEGPPESEIHMTLTRGGETKTCTLKRRQLL